MKIKNNLIHHIAGYLIGSLLFVLFIPFIISMLAQYYKNYIQLELISNYELKIIISLLFLIIGVLFIIWSLVVQNKIGKGGPAELLNIEISPKTKKLVISGPYKYTRNPMLFGTCMYYYSISIFLNSIIALMISIIFMSIMIIYVKIFEERRLLKEFGDNYIDYKAKVSIFLPYIKN